MKNMKPLWLLCTLALSACATGSGARRPPECPQPQPIPPELLTPAPVDFSERIRSYFFESVETPTPSRGN